MVLNQEVALAHGYNLYPEATGWAQPCSIRDVLMSLPSSSQKHLVGNGWHLPTLAAFMFYIWAHSVRLDGTGAASIQPEKTLLRRGGSNFLGTPRSSQGSLDGSDFMMELQNFLDEDEDEAEDEDSQTTLVLGSFR